MARINISDLTPGLYLDQDVKDRNGRLLASSGQAITPKLVRVFKIWGIGDVRIKDSDEKGASVESKTRVSESVREKAEEIVRYRFQYNDLNDPFVQELFRISCLKKVRRLDGDSANNRSADLLEPIKTDGRRRSKKGEGRINVDSLIRKTLRMETIPDIYYKIIAAVNNPETSLDDISQVVSKDIALSAKVLQLVNSSFYSLRQKVDTLTWALALIGTNQLMTIVSGVSVVSLFKKIPSRSMNMASFWEHSIACGTTARLLSSYLKVGVDSERFFVAGLLHDIGRLIMIQNFPDHFLDLFDRAKKDEIFLCVAETEKFGMDHSRIGAEIAVHWNLPSSLANMIRYHHLPGKEKNLREAAIINLADIIANALEIGNSGEFFVPVVEPRICEKLNLKKDLLQPLINQLDNQLEDIFQIIYG